MGEQKPAAKPFDISKQEVWDAWLKVKANKGAPGVDEQSIEDFEAGLKGNLYRIWNRMSSGSYFPPPVRAVEIPKAHGTGTRILGVPTRFLPRQAFSVNQANEPRMSRALRSAPTASSRNYTATDSRSACAPTRRYSAPRPSEFRFGNSLTIRPCRAVSGRAFPRSAREPQIRLTPPPRRAPDGQ